MNKQIPWKQLIPTDKPFTILDLSELAMNQNPTLNRKAIRCAASTVCRQYRRLGYLQRIESATYQVSTPPKP